MLYFQRGNPMGGILYSNAFGGQYKQMIEWHNFMGSDSFCLKACDPAGPNAAHFCEHIYDRIGCAYNAPNAARDKVFESCLGENQDFPGIYTTNGQVVTYTQPPESLGAISTMPYTARVPASSSCTPFESRALFTGLPSASGASTSKTSTATGTGATTKTNSPTTGTNGAPTPSKTSGALTVAIPGFAAAVGVVVSAVFLA